MHELGIIESLLDVARQHAARAGAARVTDLYLVLGQLSEVAEDSARFYWDFVSRGTVCEGARLHFERVPALLHCLDCDRRFTLTGEMTPCPDCGGGRLEVLAGEEFRLESIDVDVDGAPATGATPP
ncbi:MAG: hydrogenase maturation nickel metallochaperone HypA [Chloroflexi bacterium]|nr:hydrogenase maturation nickel metallochaperone HypA [Chloroflexota bacterium]